MKVSTSSPRITDGLCSGWIESGCCVAWHHQEFSQFNTHRKVLWIRDTLLSFGSLPPPAEPQTNNIVKIINNSKGVTKRGYRILHRQIGDTYHRGARSRG